MRTGCEACRTITAKDFMDADGNLSQTFVITEPGKYCLGENITFAPVTDFTPAIQILSNDVKLDLCCNTLSQVDKSVTDVYGIQIGEGYFYNDPDNLLKNITVTNGTITQFSAIGVFCYNGSFDGPTRPEGELPFELLIFTDLNVLECGSTPSFDIASGINLDSIAGDTLYDPATAVAYKNIIIENCKVNRCKGNSAINFYTGENVIIENTQANDLNTEISVTGDSAAYYIYARNLQMFNCQGNNSQNIDLITRSLAGSWIVNCVNVYVKDSQFNDVFGEASFVLAGAFLLNNQNAIYENCQFNNARGGKGTIEASGIHFSDAELQETQANGVKFINCQFNGARISDENTVDSPASGIFGVIAGTFRNIVFENCQACNIITENPGFGAYGYWTGTLLEDPTAFFGNVRNITYSNCIASDITGGRDAIGIFAALGSALRTGEQGVQSNIVIENCVAERIRSASEAYRIAGIAEGLWLFQSNRTFAHGRNLFVSNCRVSDVRSNGNEISPLSAGILSESVLYASITSNSVSDCDRGILLTGTNQIIPNGFQVAASVEDALALPPVFIPLDVQLKLFTSPAIPGSPFDALLAEYSPTLTAPISGLGAVAVDSVGAPNDACTPLTNDLTNKVGVARRGGCTFVTKTTNIEDAVGVATVIVNSVPGAPLLMGGAPTGDGPSVMISLADGNALINALNSNPPDTFTLTIDTIPSIEAVQTFSNLARGNSVDITTDQVNNKLDFIFLTENLNDLGWQAGDPIFYDCNGGTAIPDLVCSTTYFAIVYTPGFSESGVIQNNTVDNCTVSGYQDDRTIVVNDVVTPRTSSAWINNYAFNNGTPATRDTNYDIGWASFVFPMPPVMHGDLADYPTGAEKVYNVSLIP